MEVFSVNSRAKTELIDITGQIQQSLSSADVSDGLALYLCASHHCGRYDK